MEPDGLTLYASSYGPRETMERLCAAVARHRLDVLAHIDHAEGAAKVHLSLPPTDLLIFGNARTSTPLMQSAPTAGIDLPLKALVWSDAEGSTWLAYNDPSWLAARHAARSGNGLMLRDMREVLAAVAAHATSPE